MGLPYNLKMLPFPPRVRSRQFLEANPLGTVPAFFDGDCRMTESAAICQYLAARYGPGPLEVGATEHDFGAYLNWLHFGEATLTFPQTIVLRYSRFEAPERRLPQAAEDYQKWFLARLRAVDAAVSERDWLCADRFTAADISVGYALMLADYLGMAPKFPAAVSAYFDRLKQLESFQRSLQAEQQAAILQDVDPTPAPLCAN
jgi:glutathione S-transferase